MSGRIGVLVMAHGTPTSTEEIGSFYTSIRRGRPPTDDQLDELRARYSAIGGLSPLAEVTRAQVEGLAATLRAMAPGRFTVAYGAKHTEPRIEDAVAQLAGPATTELAGVVGVVLTPQHAERGAGEYLGRARSALVEADPALPLVEIEPWFDAPGLAQLWAQRLGVALGQSAETAVVFSAHSVPVASGGADLYRAQVERTAELVAGAAGLEAAGVPWRVGWQSAGRTEQRWIGPDLFTIIDELAGDGFRSVVVCPVGFVADHLEILYDIDIEAAGHAAAAGISLSRTESLNADGAFLAILAGVVAHAAEPLLR